jgi:hypothetical protein
MVRIVYRADLVEIDTCRVLGSNSRSSADLSRISAD